MIGAVRVSRESRVSLRRQIAVQVAGAIRSGAAPAGGRLPSTRALAHRLGVNRGTVSAAYRELARDGLVWLRRGSGVYVAPEERCLPRAAGAIAAADIHDPTPPGLDALLARERVAGRSAHRLARLVDLWREDLAADRVLVAARDPALRRILAHEIGAALPRLRVEEVPWETWNERTLPAGPVVAPSTLAGAVRRRLPRWREVIPVRTGDQGTVRQLLRGARPGSLVAVISHSTRLRRRVRELAAALRGRAIGVAGSRPDRERRVERLTRVARLVLADTVSAPGLAEAVRRGRGTLHRVPLVAEHSLSKLVQYLEPGTGPARRTARAGREEGDAGGRR